MTARPDISTLGPRHGPSATTGPPQQGPAAALTAYLAAAATGTRANR
jgi:hypothetical protein